MNRNPLRAFAANLRLLAGIIETNAEATADHRERDAWTTAELRLLDAIEALETAADEREGVWIKELVA